MDVHPAYLVIVLHGNHQKSDDLVTGPEQHSSLGMVQAFGRLQLGMLLMTTINQEILEDTTLISMVTPSQIDYGQASNLAS